MISKTAVAPHKYRNKIIVTNSAREGWEAILRTLKPKTKVLLPAYIGITDREGSGIYDPITNLNIAHDFYLLNSDLSISIAEIERCLLKRNYELILLVHYFGFKINNIEEIISLCKKHNIIVVEDCAHLYTYKLAQFSDVGSFGDYAFYSLHKNFPIKGGGLLLKNNIKLKLPTTENIELEANYAQQLLSYNAELIAAKRQENFKVMDKAIKGIEGVQPLKTLRKNDIPHTYPVIVKNNMREKLYFWLAEKDMTVIALYYRLIDSLKCKKYVDMVSVSNNILNLPIHQDMTKNDIEKLIVEIKQFYG